MTADYSDLGAEIAADHAQLARQFAEDACPGTDPTEADREARAKARRLFEESPVRAYQLAVQLGEVRDSYLASREQDPEGALATYRHLHTSISSQYETDRGDPDRPCPYTEELDGSPIRTSGEDGMTSWYVCTLGADHQGRHKLAVTTDEP